MMLCEVSELLHINGCTERTNGVILVSHIALRRDLLYLLRTSCLCSDVDLNGEVIESFGACVRSLLAPLLTVLLVRCPMVLERTLQSALVILLQVRWLGVVVACGPF
jgi:hypothetical protein